MDKIIRYGFGVAGIVWGALSIYDILQGDTIGSQRLMILSLVNFILFVVLKEK